MVLDGFELTAFQKFCINVLKRGAIPQHVSFVVDGSRRYANNHGVQISQISDSLSGFMIKMAHWCYMLGVKEVTTSLGHPDNFNRAADQMEPYYEEFNICAELILDNSKIQQMIIDHGVCIRAFGNHKYWPSRMASNISRLVYLTKDNNKFVINLAFGYDGREDMYQATCQLLKGVQMGLIQPSDVTKEAFQLCLYTSDSREPDLFIRTCPNRDLCDFLLWQHSYTLLEFTRKYPMELKFWDIMKIIFKYQRDYPAVKSFKEKAEKANRSLEDELDVKQALEKRPKSNDNVEGDPVTKEETDKCRKERNDRLSNLYKYLEEEKWKMYGYMINND